ncbi:unnamed protein product, partial [Staurois parvus]
MLVTVSLAMPHGTCRSKAGVSNWQPSSCCKTTSPIMPLPLGVMLVTVVLSLMGLVDLKQGCQTGSPPAVAKLQVPSCLCLWE